MSIGRIEGRGLAYAGLGQVWGQRMGKKEHATAVFSVLECRGAGDRVTIDLNPKP